MGQSISGDKVMMGKDGRIWDVLDPVIQIYTVMVITEREQPRHVLSRDCVSVSCVCCWSHEV